jgi:hypothetical protein
MDANIRLATNRQKMNEIQTQTQQLEQSRQDLLQELLRLDGENRLLMELQQEPKKE